MENINCPACGSVMQVREDPDITVDECPDCGGMFLDRGELNTLATGMAGDIEFCSIDTKPHRDKFSGRKCTKCDGVDMLKINLLQFTDVIFDYCPECGGFFLDKGEKEAMNTELQELEGTPFVRELREKKGDNVVRIDIRNNTALLGVAGGIIYKSVDLNYMVATVYFSKALGARMRVFPELLTAKLGKVFKVYDRQDIETANADFNGKFIAQGYPREVRKILTEKVMAGILAFDKKGHSLLGEPGILDVHDNRVEYVEGPYKGEIGIDIAQAYSLVLNDLVDLARLIETP
jgi:Zn-finger nucleic acid-binding protein